MNTKSEHHKHRTPASRTGMTGQSTGLSRIPTRTRRARRLIAPLLGAGCAWIAISSCSNQPNDGTPVGGDGDASGSGGDATTSADTSISVPLGGGGGRDDDHDLCADIKVEATRIIPTVAFVVEQSNGMDQELEDGQPLTRWDALRDVLLDPTTGVIPSFSSDMRMGLVLYANPPPYFPECPDLTEVMPPALDNYEAIQAIYGPAVTTPNAPTGDSLRAAAERLDAITDDGPKYLVLGTNGDPDRCDENGGQIRQDDESKALVVTAAQDAYEQGIETIVINVGRGPTAHAHLQAVANAGAGLSPDASPGAPLYEPGTRDELAESLESLLGAVRTCTFDLRGEVDEDEADRGTVMLDDVQLPMSDENGWRLVTDSRIELVGSACDTLKSGDHTFSAQFPCDVVIIR